MAETKLPIWETCVDSWRALAVIAAYPAISLPMLCAMIAMWLMHYFVMRSMMSGFAGATFLPLLTLAAALFTILAAVWTAIAVHRRILLNEPPVLRFGQLIAGRSWAYALAGFLLILVFGVAVALGMPMAWMMPRGMTNMGHGFSGFGAATMIVALAAAFYLYGRLVSILPAIAVDEDGGRLQRAWDVSRGHAWRQVAILLVGLAPLVLGFVVLNGALALVGGPIYLVANAILNFAYWIVQIVVAAALMSHSYRRLVARPGAADA